MPLEIRLPAFSPTMTAGNLVKWHVHAGQAVDAGAVLAEVEADKSTVEVIAPTAGVLTQVLVVEGAEEVPVDTVLAVLEPGEGEVKTPAEAPESKAAPLPHNERKAPAPSASATASYVPPPQPHGTHLAAGPAATLAQKMALQAGIDLASLPDAKKLRRADVEGMLLKPAPGGATPLVSTPAAPQAVNGSGRDFELLPLTSMRRTIARRLTQAKQNIPHFYMSVDCRVDSVLAYRKDYNARVQDSEKLSLNDIVVKAVAAALQAVPDANAEWTDAGIKRYHHVDLAIAVALDQGLVTPILPNAGRKSLRTLAQELKDLIARARAGKLKPEDYQGGTFTLSNLGMYGITQFQAVVNPPHAGILAVGKAIERPVVREGKLEVGTVMNLTLSADHRVIDGAVGARLLTTLQSYLEQPFLMLA